MKRKILVLLPLLLVGFILFTTRNTNTLRIPDKNWERIELEFSNCNVASASQRHNLTVSVGLKDGTYISAKEPSIDEIWDLVNESEKRCGTKPLFITE